MRLELTDIKSVLLPTGYLVQMYSYGSDYWVRVTRNGHTVYPATNYGEYENADLAFETFVDGSEGIKPVTMRVLRGGNK